jgi:hypothetical protein
MAEERCAGAGDQAADPIRGQDTGLGTEFRVLDDPVRGVAGSLDEMVHGVGGIFEGLDDLEAAKP